MNIIKAIITIFIQLKDIPNSYSESIKINSFNIIQGTTFTMIDGTNNYTSANIFSTPIYSQGQTLKFTTTGDAICRINYTEQ